jgi:glutaconate CoA-transferase, subunit B
MTYAKDYSTTELMGVCVSRHIKSEDVVFIGVGVPLIAGVLAVATHAPEATLIYEGGGIGARARRIPFTISDNATTDNALSAASMWRVMHDQQCGFVTLGVIGGAEVDRFGNLNTTVILGKDGTYAHPKVRLAGSGGANDIATSAGRTVIMMRLQKGKFVERVQYLTSPGYLTGPGEREKLGMRGKGPVAVITEKCIFGFDEQTREMCLETLYPGTTVEAVKALVGWDLKVSAGLQEVEPPTEEQIRIMRAYDPMGFILGKKTPTGTEESFDDFYQKIRAAYQSIPLDLD